MNTNKIIEELTECELVRRVDSGLSVLCERNGILPVKLDQQGRLTVAALRDTVGAVSLEGKLDGVIWRLEATEKVVRLRVGCSAVFIPRGVESAQLAGNCPQTGQSGEKSLSLSSSELGSCSHHVDRSIEMGKWNTLANWFFNENGSLPEPEAREEAENDNADNQGVRQLSSPCGDNENRPDPGKAADDLRKAARNLPESVVISDDLLEEVGPIDIDRLLDGPESASDASLDQSGTQCPSEALNKLYGEAMAKVAKHKRSDIIS